MFPAVQAAEVKMLLGTVSDERFVALAGAQVEIDDGSGADPLVLTSSPRGGLYATLTPGEYRISLACAGYGPKVVHCRLGSEPVHFRLLSNRLLGYVWPKWARGGETGEYRVHSMGAYRLTLWRYGRYREQVSLLGWLDEHGPNANQQVLPDSITGDISQVGAQWNLHGHRTAHLSQRVIAPERSGLYFFRAEGESGEFFSFPWVVAPASPRAQVAVLAATNNWNAYNNFGGRSNYIHAAGLPSLPTVNARLELPRYQAGGAYPEWRRPNDAYPPLSFDRPEPNNTVGRDEEVSDPIRGRQQCHLAAAEWRLLAWMEREGYDYDLYAEGQLHSGELNLDAYKVLVLSTHPEYWSAAMYDRVKAWVFDRGGKLMYLGGNGLNCEVELPGDGTMRCRTQVLGHGGVPDPAGGLAPESRFGRTHESEANLLGVVFTEAGVMTAAPYEVLEPDHWVFRGSGLAAGDLFGRVSLHERIPGGASGHETDKRSPSSPEGTILLARGLNPGEGGAEIVLHETGSGGAVFSVGSITWPACILVDPGVSSVTGNVLDRFLS